MKFLLFGTALAQIVFASAGFAQSSKAFEIGKAPCEKWAAYRAGKDAKSLETATGYLIWIEGFGAAMATVSRNINVGFSRIDGPAIGAWVDNFCATHPGEDISAAAFRLAVSLGDLNNLPYKSEE